MEKIDLTVEEYYEQYLKGRSKDELTKQIKGLRSRIRKMQRECDADVEEQYIPQGRREINLTRRFLERAKKTFGEIGEVYVPEGAEKKIEEFDAKIKSIRGIFYSSGGFFGGYRAVRILFAGEQVWICCDFSDFGEERKTIKLLHPLDKKKFLRRLHNLHIGEWRKRYWDEGTCDGTQWDIAFVYGDKDLDLEAFKAMEFKDYYFGSNAYPYNMDLFERLLFNGFRYYDFIEALSRMPKEDQAGDAIVSFNKGDS